MNTVRTIDNHKSHISRILKGVGSQTYSLGYSEIISLADIIPYENWCEEKVEILEIYDRLADIYGTTRYATQKRIERFISEIRAKNDNKEYINNISLRQNCEFISSVITEVYKQDLKKDWELRFVSLMQDLRIYNHLSAFQTLYIAMKVLSEDRKTKISLPKLFPNSNRNMQNVMSRSMRSEMTRIINSKELLYVLGEDVNESVTISQFIRLVATKVF